MFKLLIISLVILFGFYEQVVTLSLPPYMKICHVGPGLNDCVLKSSNDAIPTALKGDRKYRYPPFDPLEIKKMEITDDNRKSVALNVSLSDAKVIGLAQVKMTKANFDVDKKRMDFTFAVPKLEIDGHYKVNGKFLVLPIFGDGPGRIFFDDCEFTLNIYYDLVNKKGEEYININRDKSQLKYNVGKMQIDLKNLFNGDETLSKNMLASLNENWKELLNALGPGLSKGINQVVLVLIDELTKLVPYKEFVQQ